MKRDLKADLELCNKVTEGPWICDLRVGCVAVYPENIGRVNCMGDSEGKRLFYRNGFQVKDENGYFKEWCVKPQDVDDAEFIAQAREGWPHAIERALEAEAKLEKAKGLIQRWFDGEISAFGVMDSMIIDLEFDIDGIPDEALEYHNIKRKEVLGDE